MILESDSSSGGEGVPTVPKAEPLDAAAVISVPKDEAPDARAARPAVAAMEARPAGPETKPSSLGWSGSGGGGAGGSSWGKGPGRSTVPAAGFGGDGSGTVAPPSHGMDLLAMMLGEPCGTTSLETGNNAGFGDSFRGGELSGTLGSGPGWGAAAQGGQGGFGGVGGDAGSGAGAGGGPGGGSWGVGGSQVGIVPDPFSPRRDDAGVTRDWGAVSVDTSSLPFSSVQGGVPGETGAIPRPRGSLKDRMKNILAKK